MLHLSITPTRTAIFYKAKRPFLSTKTKIPRIQVANNTRQKNEMSPKARKRIRKAINWLTYLSETRNEKFSGGRIVRNFKVSFVTLTLPTKQMHSHQEITQKCLNRFLTVLRQKYKVQNYVWKAELQKNGNIHYHLTFDVFIHYLAIRREWNAAISKLGYITTYAKTFRTMTFEEYHYWRCQSGSENVNANKKAFAYGTATNWHSPNTTDVKSVKNVKNLASYLAKYLTKSPAKSDVTGIIADSVKELTGRLWFCSRSISSMASVQIPLTMENRRITFEMSRIKQIKSEVFEWTTLFWYRLKELPPDLRNWFRENLVSYAIDQNYPFPAGFPS